MYYKCYSNLGLCQNCEWGNPITWSSDRRVTLANQDCSKGKEKLEITDTHCVQETRKLQVKNPRLIMHNYTLEHPLTGCCCELREALNVWRLPAEHFFQYVSKVVI